MIELRKNQYNFSKYFVKYHQQTRAFNSLSFRGKKTYPSEFLHKKQHTYGAILCVNNKYALVQGRYTGKWSFPKGHANKGETPIECTLRELCEETGITELPEPTDYLQVGYGNYYVFNLSEQIPLIPQDTVEIVDTKWVSLQEMNNLQINADVSMYKKMYQV